MKATIKFQTPLAKLTVIKELELSFEKMYNPDPELNNFMMVKSEEWSKAINDYIVRFHHIKDITFINPDEELEFKKMLDIYNVIT